MMIRRLAGTRGDGGRSVAGSGNHQNCRKRSGASGAQYFHRDFEAVGAEAFLPPNKTKSATSAEAKPDHDHVTNDEPDAEAQLPAVGAPVGSRRPRHELTVRLQGDSNRVGAEPSKNGTDDTPASDETN